VLKRDVLEGDRADAATKLVRKLGRRKPRMSQPTQQPVVGTTPAAPPS
jgi:hypothetical protein